MSAIRGCDNEQRNSPTKLLIRNLRAAVLVCHCGDPLKAATFIETSSIEELSRRMNNVRKDMDHLPHHFVMHLCHAAEIIGYKHPDSTISRIWREFYFTMVKCFHMNPETEEGLDLRLNADEDTFAKAAMESNGLPMGTTVRVSGG